MAKKKREYKKISDFESMEILDNLIQSGRYKFWKYQYETYREDWEYSLEDFKKVDDRYNNHHPNGLSNYEQLAGDSKRLVVAKTMVQAFNDPEMALLLTEYARLSLYLPVNKYGFYCVSYSYIEKDIRMSEYKQRKLSNKLAQLGYIDIKSYNFENSNVEYKRFYRFNDDFSRKKLEEFRKKSFVETPYINEQD